MFDEVIGQTELKRSVEVAIIAARRRGETLGHLLLSGAGGLGKTHLLHAICKELGYHNAITQGNRLTPRAVAKFLIENCQDAGVPAFLIIDEIHEMSDEAQEELFFPMDKGQILTLGSPTGLGPFTLAGATTDPQELNGKSLINRFRYYWQMEELSLEELMFLLNDCFLRQGIRSTWEPMHEIAKRSRGTPRLALKYAYRARDFAEFQGRDEILIWDVEETFAELEIDSFGIDKNQRRYLTILQASGKPIGLDAIASKLDEMKADQVRKMVEPYLWKLGLITSSSRGRELTPAAHQYFLKTTVLKGSAPRLVDKRH